MLSDRGRDVLSDYAFKGEVGASKARVSQKRNWRAETGFLDFLYRTVAGRPSPKAMNYEEAANRLG